jgi:uncharacterized protein YcbK (DUF882 family)
MKNISVRNFKLSEVVHSEFDALPLELYPIACIALGYIQAIRDILKVPIVITSGYRSPAYNQSIGGSANSYHMWRFDKDGKPIFAMDIISPGMSAAKLYELVHPIVNGEVYLHKKLQFVHVGPYGADENWIL